MAMSDKQILETLAEVVTAETGMAASQILPEKSFTNDLDIDSIATMTIVAEADAKFNIITPDEETASISTVADFIALIKPRQAISERLGVLLANDYSLESPDLVRAEASFEKATGITDAAELNLMFAKVFVEFECEVSPEAQSKLKKIGDLINLIAANQK
jgi:acyl carrier protein